MAFCMFRSETDFWNCEKWNKKKEVKKMKKLLVIVVAAMVALLPFQGQLYAITFIAEGEVTGTSTFNAVLGNAGAQINFPKGSGYEKGDTYIEVTFNDNSSGYQAITIATDNRNAAASPKYTGIAQGNGLIGETTANQVVPMLWMVNPTVISGGYTFTGAAGEYYVTDLKQGTDATNDPTKGASKCNDVNKNSVCDAGEYTDRN